MEPVNLNILLAKLLSIKQYLKTYSLPIAVLSILCLSVGLALNATRIAIDAVSFRRIATAAMKTSTICSITLVMTLALNKMMDTLLTGISA